MLYVFLKLRPLAFESIYWVGRRDEKANFRDCGRLNINEHLRPARLTADKRFNSTPLETEWQPLDSLAASPFVMIEHLAHKFNADFNTSINQPTLCPSLFWAMTSNFAFTATIHKMMKWKRIKCQARFNTKPKNEIAKSSTLFLAGILCRANKDFFQYIFLVTPTLSRRKFYFEWTACEPA